jgi:hypothetical protein
MIYDLRNLKLKTYLILLVVSCCLLFVVSAKSALAASPQSTTYKLIEYGFGSGGSTNSASTNYGLYANTGEVSIGLPGSSTYKAGLGLIFTLTANTPAVPTLSIPAGNYDRIKIVIDTGSNPIDATYAIAISTDNFANDIRYVKSDKSVSTTQAAGDFLSYSGWGGASGTFIWGLNYNTAYYIKVKARQGNFTDSPYSLAANITTGNPTLSFGLDTSSITFSNLNSGNSYTDSSRQTILTTSTNAYNGYIVYANENQSLTYSGKTIADYNSSNETPTTWSGTGFGYNSSDVSLDTGPGLANRFVGSKYAGFQILSQDPVVDHTAIVDNTAISIESFIISYRVTTPSTQEGGSYTNSIIYTIVPIY